MEEELEKMEFTASAGGGVITATVANKQITALTIKPEAVDPDDVETLTDLLVAGVNEAIKRVETTNAAEMEKITGSMNLPGMF